MISSNNFVTVEINPRTPNKYETGSVGVSSKKKEDREEGFKLTRCRLLYFKIQITT